MCNPAPYVEKNGEITQFPLNNNFFASYRDRRLFVRAHVQKVELQKVELQKVELQKVEWQKVEWQKVEQSKGRTIKR